MYGAAQLRLTNKIIITAFQTAINIVIKDEARDIHACNRSQHQKRHILWHYPEIRADIGDVSERGMNIHSTKIFSSYWQAGYEGSDHVNRANRSLSMNELTRHLHRARNDYSLLEEFEIKTVRESRRMAISRKEWAFRFLIH